MKEVRCQPIKFTKLIIIDFFFLSLDFYIPNQHTETNPFLHHPSSTFVNSGPDSFIDVVQYGNEYYQQQHHQPPIPPAPRTPNRTPVMGTRTYQHRRTLSNTSSQYSSHRGSNIDYGEVLNVSDLDYRFNNFNSIPHQQTTLTAEPLKFNSVPYSVNSKNDTLNSHSVVPDRMRLYENITNLQLQQLRGDSHVPSSPSRQSQNVLQQIKTTHIETIQPNDLSRKMITTSVTAANALRREMFFSSVDNPSQHIEMKEQNLSFNNKFPGSTGCTPTHSTPHDSFSDDSSYLSALSSMNRVRLSPDNFLEEANATLSPTSRMAVANSYKRAMAQRTIELEESLK